MPECNNVFTRSHCLCVLALALRACIHSHFATSNDPTLVCNKRLFLFDSSLKKRRERRLPKRKAPRDKTYETQNKCNGLVVISSKMEAQVRQAVKLGRLLLRMSSLVNNADAPGRDNVFAHLHFIASAEFQLPSARLKRDAVDALARD